MPPEDRTASPAAVSHVATMVRDEGRPDERRDVVTRAGNWIRSDRTESGRTTTHFSHLASRTSFSYSRGADGQIAAIRVARDPSDSPYYRMRRVATGGRDRVVGETCQVWRVAPVGDLAGDWEWLSCETRDGIQLRVREQYGPTGVLIVESRAVAVSRRRIAQENVRPPAQFFAIGSLPGGPAWTEPGPDYRVVLESDSVDRGGPGRKIIQRRGAFLSNDVRNADGSRELNMSRGEFRIHYMEEPGGRPITLWVNEMPDDDAVNISSGGSLRVEGRDPETILGETCYWMRWTVIMSHYRQMQCETQDGIVLATDEQSMAGHTVYRAVSLSRDRLSPEDFRLPDRAVALRGWGVASN